ncbi:hypothetical protein [Sulfurisphaera ohwakuensis]|uniref:Uncharacterized protein n=1 Tax=Sulfurisphaera ohwakuensis TaxID=69656 RepID=A0A650CD76_SULOH|nr:hypothetical protein [Sulfurisphaera ohwakuensis]MBB5253309.1 hypothetical protein [Sulfurisphaera ohwakuensis]QGR15793.1 hypothetical protein D1869_00230 [Sulfurisphaera ohwakuensis]
MINVPDWVIEVLEETDCEYCGAEIVYARTKKGIGVFDARTWKPHRLTCPYSPQWSKKVGRREMKQTHLEDFGILRDE